MQCWGIVMEKKKTLFLYVHAHVYRDMHGPSCHCFRLKMDKISSFLLKVPHFCFPTPMCFLASNRLN